MDKVKCPHCGESFNLQDSFKQDYELQVKQQFDEQLLSEKKKIQSDLEKKNEQLAQKELNDLKKSLEEDFKSRFKSEKEKFEEEFAKKNDELEEEQIKLIKENAIKDIQKKHLEDQDKQLKHNKRLEETINQMKASLQQTAEKNKALTERAEVQVAGEVGENYVKDALEKTFTDDNIIEVKRGQRGGDWIIEINGKKGFHSDKIYIEVKNTQSFSNAWINKLKEDMQDEGISTGIIITNAFPKNTNQHIPFFKEKNILVCRLDERAFLPLIIILRDELIKRSSMVDISAAKKTDTPQLVFDYITSDAFSDKMQMIWDQFDEMSVKIDRRETSYRRFVAEDRNFLDQTKQTLLRSLLELKEIAPSSKVGLPEHIDDEYND